jgi:hypothetical protein
MFKRILGFFQGCIYALLKLEPDSIALPRLEAKIEEIKAKRNNALTKLATLTVAVKRKKEELEPKVEEKKALIKQMIANGDMDAAGDETEELERLEAEYKEAFDTFTSSKETLEAEAESSNAEIQNLQKQLISIRDQSKRVAAEKELNDLKKAASGSSFSTSDVAADLNRMKDRLQTADDKNKAERMVMDLNTQETKQKNATTAAAAKAAKQLRLARFAASEGITLPTEKEVTRAPIGTAEEPNPKGVETA